MDVITYPYQDLSQAMLVKGGNGMTSASLMPETKSKLSYPLVPTTSNHKSVGMD